MIELPIKYLKCAFYLTFVNLISVLLGLTYVILDKVSGTEMKDNFDMTSTCIQGGYPRSVGGYQVPFQRSGQCSPLMASLCPPGVQQNQTQYMEDRSDSGINSGSEGHASSPGSDNGAERYPSPTDQSEPPTKLPYHSTPIFQRTTRPHPNVPAPGIYHWNSPPSHPVEIKMEPEAYEEKEFDSNRTSTQQEAQNTSPLKCLEMSFDRNLNMPASSPVISECDDRKSEYDDAPRINSHGKIKTFPCKQCSFVAKSKSEFWKHRKSNHIKPEKLLSCPLCPFNTEYKHHFEYHLRNHEGSKPFKCDHCDYSCVNKSMLNSHKKSHSNIYQYRCADCHYVSKYCHSLKMHLRKHGHQPGMVLNPDGSPNPLPIIDVYGTRRGPKVKPIHEGREDEDQQGPIAPQRGDLVAPPAGFPLHLQQFMAQTPPMPLAAYTLYQQASMFYQSLGALAREELTSKIASDKPEPMEQSSTEPSEALDLTKENKKASSISSDEEEDYQSETYKYVETVLSADKSDDEEGKSKETEKPQQNFHCQYCLISFEDEVLYTMHMGYHGYQDPFTCNMCGDKCSDRISFFLHIARTPHSYNQ